MNTSCIKGRQFHKWFCGVCEYCGAVKPRHKVRVKETHERRRERYSRTGT